MKTKKLDDQYTDDEIARRRDDTIKRMINTPPMPHKPLGEVKPKAGTRPKKRGHPPHIEAD